MPSDEELIKEIHQGSQAAMEVLVRRHYKMIFAYLYRRTADYHISLDLTQETLIRMMKSLSIYKEQGKFAHWLLTLAVNICRDYYRSRQYKESLTTPLQNSMPFEPYSNVEDLLNQQEVRIHIQSALQELSDSQREAIVLKYYHEMKVSEIAQTTSSQESAVKSRLFQGIAKLKRILGRMVADEENQG
ncbi:RNA polymerase sigma factor [Paenibacillus psychroresistens]|uniref:RNA polymerase sigma factor n=1 Tax=Paenibacillus psychroresistens TaxID=1778678 RepID=A0A6B8RT00_9BACL|nr:RNA polymerase sigma factor [Paenibacillus psychroresistens]QGQ98573.1 RNA polymerase sigma factor [Paenibacillus psychroresistens]